MFFSKLPVNNFKCFATHLRELWNYVFSEISVIVTVNILGVRVYIKDISRVLNRRELLKRKSVKTRDPSFVIEQSAIFSVTGGIS